MDSRGQGTPIVVELMIDWEADPIRGSVRADGHEGHAFTGWIGLVAALEGVAGVLRPIGLGPGGRSVPRVPERRSSS